MPVDVPFTASAPFPTLPQAKSQPQPLQTQQLPPSLPNALAEVDDRDLDLQDITMSGDEEQDDDGEDSETEASPETNHTASFTGALSNPSPDMQYDDDVFRHLIQNQVRWDRIPAPPNTPSG